jgi:hypothetical protein
VFRLSEESNVQNLCGLLESLFQVRRKLRASGKIARTGESHVIFAKSVRNNEVRFVAVVKRPIGQVIRIRIGIVLEATFFQY